MLYLNNILCWLKCIIYILIIKHQHNKNKLKYKEKFIDIFKNNSIASSKNIEILLIKKYIF